MPTDETFTGLADNTSGNSELNALSFLFQRLLRGVWTSMPVQVMAVTNSGGVSPVGTVDIQPLVHQIDGDGKATPHGVINEVPYARMQGGANAVILDPQVGDLGLAIFASRDISAVVAKKATNVPGSRRVFDPADAIYVSTILGAAPTQYVRFFTGGMEMVSPTKITLQAPDIEFVGPTHTTGAVTGDSTAVYTGDVTGAGTHLHTHTHNVEHVQGGTATIPTDAPN